MSTVLLLNVRLSFPSIIEPNVSVIKSTGKSISKYRATLLMEPEHPGYKKFMEEVYNLAAEKWKELGKRIVDTITEKNKRCFGDGNEQVSQKTMEVYDGYEGMKYITANNDHRVQIFKPDGQPCDFVKNSMEYQEFARKFYPGCYVNAVVSPWLQDNPDKTIGRGVRCTLMGLQFSKHGTEFGRVAEDLTGKFPEVADPFDSVGVPAASPSGDLW